MNLPDEYKSKIEDLLGPEADAYFECLDRESARGLRANTLKVTPEALAVKLPYLTERVPWCPDGFYYPESEKPAKSPYYNAGLFYLQEPCAMAAVEFADIRPGHRVLDICAAPGGKSAHIAAKLAGDGLLVANDSSASRCAALVRNLEICGAANAAVLAETPERLAQWFGGFFDRIVLDAPCSGEGMFRKDPSAVSGWNRNKPEKCVGIQRLFLKYCDLMLKDGGRMLYSTCTFDPAENEGNIGWFLRSRPEYDIIPVKHACFDKGRPDLVVSEPGAVDERLSGCARLWPHKLKGEGHFLCALKKNLGPAAESAGRAAKSAGKPPTAAMAFFNGFCRDTLDADNFFGKLNGKYELRIYSDSLYAVPAGLPDLSGLRVIRSGWRLGDMPKGRFEPSQAFAMGLGMGEIKRAARFDEETAAKYLRGESFGFDMEDGWAAVCFEGYPLGWGKVKEKYLKNRIKKGWVT